MNKWFQEFSIAKKALMQAGEAIMRYYKHTGNIFMKGKDNPVTEADFTSEKILLSHLKQFNYGILSEETHDDKSRLLKDLVWIIDPLDGTKDFLQKTGEFTIMLALVKKGVPVLGLIYQPTQKRLFYALKGRGAFVEETGGKAMPLHVSQRNKLKTMRLFVSRNHLLALEIQLSKKLHFSKVIPCGSAGLKASLITLDKGDVYINTSDRTFEWDICAADIIVREAGGELTDMIGKRIKYNKKNPQNIKGFVVSNGKKHKEIIEWLLTQNVVK